MTPDAIALLSMSMSTDAFAAAVGRGVSRRPSIAKAMRAGGVFGIIESLTPIIGWMLGILAASFVQQVDHWIAFSLLTIVGGKMVIDAVTADKTGTAPARSGMTALIATAIGTSLDAAAIGVGLAFIGVNIWVIAASIGFTTFVFTTFGMLIGGMVGARFGRWAEIGGGVVPQSDAARLSTAYYWKDGKRLPFEIGAQSMWLHPAAVDYGGSALVSSARDYDRFLQMLANGGSVGGVRVLDPDTVKLAMSNLLPPGVRILGNITPAPVAAEGFGAGGEVFLKDVPDGVSAGTYGWFGAAGSFAFIDPAKRLRVTVMVNYFPDSKWPLYADVVKAVYRDSEQS